MDSPPVQTAIALWGSRALSADDVMDQARALQHSKVVDDLALLDHLVNLIPPSLWTPANAPMAALVPDVDSLHDAFVIGALAHAAAPRLGLAFSTDAIRRGPAETIQTMLSFASLTEGRARFMFGAGEAKQCLSFGHRREEGLSRQEDLLRIFRALWESDGPVDHAGHHWEMKQAYLGAIKPHRPEVWVMGTGPKQLELAAELADGVCSLAPFAWATPEQAAEEIVAIRAMFEQHGRDPDSIGFGIHAAALLHEDPDVIDRALDNAIVRWLAAIYGRVNPEDWRREGIEPATPEGWTYYMRYAPYLTDEAFISGVLAKATRTMAERAFMSGTPTEVAREVDAYVDAGCTWVCINDLAPIVGTPQDAVESARRIVEVCDVLTEAVRF